MNDCVFCRIAQSEAPARMVRDEPGLLAFEDIHPQAPVHVLVIPRAHIPTLAEAGDPALLGRLVDAANAVARERGLHGGYRVVVNQGPDGGQTVWHLHLHLLGGRQMSWPPG